MIFLKLQAERAGKLPVRRDGRSGAYQSVASDVRPGRLRARLLLPVEGSPIDWQSNLIIFTCLSVCEGIARIVPYLFLNAIGYAMFEPAP